MGSQILSTLSITRQTILSIYILGDNFFQSLDNKCFLSVGNNYFPSLGDKRRWARRCNQPRGPWQPGAEQVVPNLSSEPQVLRIWNFCICICMQLATSSFFGDVFPNDELLNYQSMLAFRTIALVINHFNFDIAIISENNEVMNPGW